MIFITGRNKTSISNHFDTAYELEMELESRSKTEMLEMVRNITPPNVSCVFIRQSMALGLGHAVLCAEPVVGNEPFAVILADDLIDDGARGCLAQMVEVFAETGCSILGTERVPPENTASYGIVATEGEGKLVEVKGIVEKPKPEDAPSDLGVVGRYILTPEIFRHLARTGRGAGGEVQLTDGIARLLEREKVMAYAFEGRRYDCGSKLGYLQANLDYALKHEDLGADFEAWVKQRLGLN
jgi:UTP--glucose-1-phosphate uridylyltransferase